jgi:predicted  nucleic acid-binding Zn-ribbon protein
LKKTMPILLLTILCFSGLTAGVNALENTDNAATAIHAAERYGLDALSAEVADLVSRVGVAKPTGTMNERQRQFIELHQAIDQLDEKIDMAEGKVNADYLSGTLTWDEYRNMDRKLDALGDRLDRAEDRLERVFRMDG